MRLEACVTGMVGPAMAAALAPISDVPYRVVSSSGWTLPSPAMQVTSKDQGRKGSRDRNRRVAFPWESGNG